MQKILDLIKLYSSTISAVAAAGGIMFGVITWIVAREARIKGSVTKEEFLEVTDKISNRQEDIIILMDNTRTSVSEIQEQVTIMNDGFIKHIRKDPNMSSDEKIQDILDLTKYIYNKVYGTSGEIKEAERITDKAKIDSIINKK